jgi:hypothetical protein
MANGSEPEKIGHRDWLAMALLIFSVFSVSVLAITIILKGGDPSHVMTAVLPLLGSWVGTVLAFYFSKDNFAAATRSVSELTKQLTTQEKLQATLAKEKMIPRSQMFAIPVTREQKLSDILEKLKQANKGMRIPFLAQQDYPRYVIHRSVIDRFLADRAINPSSPPINLADLTLDDMLSDPDLKNAIEQSIATVGESATLADVKELMDKNPHCQDVFVTKGGTKDEPALGWITNAIVEENTKL